MAVQTDVSGIGLYLYVTARHFLNSSMDTKTVITGTGCYVPEVIKTNRDFTAHDFYADDNKRIEADPHEVVEKFREITGIEERRYACENINSSDMAIIASRIAIEDSGIDPEEIDQIILAHNFGNV